MKISVVTVCLNSATVVRDCLISVFFQSYSDTEHVVIDGHQLVARQFSVADIINAMFCGHMSS